jgi:hypothetical protein
MLYNFGKLFGEKVALIHLSSLRIRLICSSILVALAGIIFYAFFGSKAWFLSFLINLYVLLFAYTFVQKELDKLFDDFFTVATSVVKPVFTALKWCLYAVIALIAVVLIFNFLSSLVLNPIVVAIVFGAWMIAVAIQSK